MLSPFKLAVLGWPIIQSRSPEIHAAAYRELQLPWKYSAVRVGEAGLAGFLRSRGDEWRGLSVTMPLKNEAFKLAQTHDEVAQESGVVNTLLRVSGGTEAAQWAGFNTDVSGLAEAVRKTDMDVRRSVVLGAGATAVSAVLALRRLGAREICVIARRSDAALALVSRFDGTREGDASHSAPVQVSSGSFEAAEEVLERLGGAATAVVSTLPSSAGAAAPIVDVLHAAPLFDVAYSPWPSPLATRWQKRGGEAHSGIGMLVEQALIQLRIFVNGNAVQPLPNEAGLLETMHRASVGG